MFYIDMYVYDILYKYYYKYVHNFYIYIIFKYIYIYKNCVFDWNKSS